MIEERNDTFMRLLYSNTNRDEVAQAHRDAMLAVLDEAVLRAKQYEGVLGMGYVDELDALRTCIQELGKVVPSKEPPVKAEGS